jgi:hypothetical protein
LARIYAVIFGEMMKRLTSAFLVKDPLARITNITATIRSGQIRFLLAPANRLEDVRHLDCGWLLRLKNLVDFLIVTICDIRQLASEIMDASKSSRIRVFLYAILSGDVPSELFALVENLDEGIGRFALLRCERPSLGGVKQVCNVVVSICNLPTILDPCMQTRNCHFAGPLVTND